VHSVESIRFALLDWARGESNVLALIETGATAGIGGRPDAFSDLDIEVVARDPHRLVSSDGWFEAFGDVWVVLRFDELSYPTRLVVYDGGAKVDYTLAGVDRLAEMQQQLDPLYERGYRVLLDKEALAQGLPQATGAFPQPPAPTQRQFDAVVGEFWFEATQLPRYLARDELWVVKFRDWTMKQDLLTMLEWHATAPASSPVDVRYLGMGIAEWVGGSTRRELSGIFGRFDRHDSWLALLATTNLFARVARETAEAHALAYPSRLEGNVQRYLASLAPPPG
jgi:aminoglycoside 6-adenylyltransferase